MQQRRFEAVVSASGGLVVVPLPFRPDAAWGARGRHHLCGTVGGRPWRGELQGQGDQAFLPLGPVWRRDNGIDAGQVVEVVLAPEGPQIETMGEDVAAALRPEPEAAAFFADLPTFYRNNYARWIAQAKRPETRARRVAELVALLREGRRER